MDKDVGKLGENHVAEFLKKHGYQILERNFRTRFGEIDIIACDRKYIVFVEVKTRGEKRIAEPLEWITPGKRRRIISAADYYLQVHPCGLQPRFDAAGVVMDGRGIAGPVVYVENAFDGSEGVAFF